MVTIVNAVSGEVYETVKDLPDSTALSAPTAPGQH
jgi:hypothetical protein